MRGIAAVAALLAAAGAAALTAGSAGGAKEKSLALELVGRYTGGGAEIAAYDPHTQRLFVTDADNARIDIVSIADPASPSLVRSISVAPGSPNSVAVDKGVVAVAVEAPTKTDPGSVRFYDDEGTLLHPGVTVGALPDMLAFTPDHRHLLVANEGEPSGYGAGQVDPEGSVSVIDVRGGVPNVTQADVRTAGFAGVPVPAGVRVYGPGAAPAQDLEPEYIAISKNGKTAWVTLQENNAIAELDVGAARITAIRPLGFKDHSLARSALDPSDRDGGIHIAPWPVLGMYQPDALGAYAVGGRTYLVTANEGDARDWPGFSEEARVKDLPLDPALAPYMPDAQLGRLTVTRTLGSTDADADYERLYAFGARSFSIWSQDGSLVYDSGDDFEQITAARIPALFNSESGAGFDSRSDNKGPEPEGLALGKIDGRTYAFVGLERIGGVIAYDVTDPNAPRFVQYVNPAPGVDKAPEGLLLVDAADSSTGTPLLVVTNEVSGTTTIYSIEPA